ESVDPQVAAEYFSAHSGNVIACDSPDVELEVRLTAADRKPSESELARSDLETEPPTPVGLGLSSPNSVRLSPVAATTKRIHGPGGGLNHGVRPNRKNKSEAYIPIPAQVGRSGFFPPQGQHVRVTTDDDKVLLMSTGSGPPGQPKDLRTPLN